MPIDFRSLAWRVATLSMVCLAMQACTSVNHPSLFAQPSASNASSNSRAKALINGQDLNAWKLVGNANWRLQEGLVQAELGDGFLITRDSYQNFRLVAEFWVDDEANSGIFFAAPTRW